MLTIFASLRRSEGNYIFKNIPTGKYILEVNKPNFEIHKIVNLEINGSENLSINIELRPISVVVGIFLEEPLIDMNSSSITTKITRKQVENLPY